MPEWIELIRYTHVIGATILFGTGMGIAFFMFMAHQSKSPKIIAHVSNSVVIADTIFTATAAIIQPITGAVLASYSGWSLTEGWILLSLLLYVFVGLFWLPVVYIQLKIRRISRRAVNQGTTLGRTYERLYRIWFIFGFPAFFAVLAIFWLMLFKPDINLSLGL